MDLMENMDGNGVCCDNDVDNKSYMLSFVNIYCHDLHWHCAGVI